MSRFYILEGREVKQVEDFEMWETWFQKAIQTHMQTHIGCDCLLGMCVSTVFLGIDHSQPLGDEQFHAPLVFETMIFGGPEDGYQERYSTWDQAERGHLKALQRVVDIAPHLLLYHGARLWAQRAWDRCRGWLRTRRRKS